MANDNITMTEKENPPRVKEEYSTLTNKVTYNRKKTKFEPTK